MGRMAPHEQDPVRVKQDAYLRGLVQHLALSYPQHNRAQDI